ncbi:cupin domain-containing protein [Sulfitobacter sp. HNIBRBA3233]|uniref:cupin domain-containing protein n=1 Tax=Sulfitobacter marinivivus TaxID=3158558 RepID=UPI0032E01AFF
MTPEEIIAHLDLAPHPEGGHYRQTWIAGNEGRPTGTCIYFLLRAGERSDWHRVDATEIWHFHAGDPLQLELAESESGPARTHLLTGDLRQGMPQIIVPQDHWQRAASTGAYTLVSCTVSPGFRFEGFELRPDLEIPR